MLQVKMNVKTGEPVFNAQKDYKCLSLPRGHVFVANYANFQGKPQDYRFGSEQDEVNLEALFTKVRYELLL